MILKEENDRLNEVYQVCKLHEMRMSFAYSKIKHLFPLTLDTYENMELTLLSIADQFVYRFSKLQDCIGAKLFKSILENLGEETRSVPFIDIINRLELIGVLNDSEQWLILREIRNNLSHEYPLHKQDMIDGLNNLFEHYNLMIDIWIKIENYILTRFKFLIQNNQ